MEQKFIVKEEGRKLLEEGGIDDPYYELILEIMVRADVPVTRQNVFDLVKELVLGYGSPERVIMLLRSGELEIKKEVMQ